MSNPKPLTLEISLDSLRHLGMNLYSSLPPVLSELVANAYDARARRVDITVADDRVTIRDDGIGMTRDDAQEKYLVVGRDRRVEDQVPVAGQDPFSAWPRRDTPMGRKGIGKLAMFSVADEVELISSRGHDSVGMTLSRAGIEEAAKARRDYLPGPLDVPADFTQGTQITLKCLRRIRAVSADRVKKSIARHFSVIDMDDAGAVGPNVFVVYVNGVRITAADWDVFGKLQFMWYLGPESKAYAGRCPAGCKSFALGAEVRLPDGTTARVTGWLGTVKKPEDLQATSGPVEINDNRIIVDARGKLAIRNFLQHFGESGYYASYLAGYIRADFLDSDAEDIATSDRERMKEDDPRVKALGEFVWEQLKKIQVQWRELRHEAAIDDSKQEPVTGPIVTEWLAGLNDDETVDAKSLIGRLNTARFSSDADRAQVLKFGILAFERLRVQRKLHILRNSPDGQLETIAAMFALETDLENALYADIASQRLQVVKELDRLVDSDEKEKTIQRHIFDHLWLLEPSWTLQDHLSKKLEQRVTTEFAKVKLPKALKQGRLDIRYRSSGGIHIIVELKKPDVRVDAYELLRQVTKYRNALKLCLREVEGVQDPNIQCVCLVGRLPTLGPEEDGALLAGGTKIRTYDSVISDSCKRFADYIEAEKKFGRIQEILAKLDGLEGAGSPQATAVNDPGLPAARTRPAGGSTAKPAMNSAADRARHARPARKKR